MTTGVSTFSSADATSAAGTLSSGEYEKPKLDVTFNGPPFTAPPTVRLADSPAGMLAPHALLPTAVPALSDLDHSKLSGSVNAVLFVEGFM